MQLSERVTAQPLQDSAGRTNLPPAPAVQAPTPQAAAPQDLTSPNRRLRPGARRPRGLPRRRSAELAALDWQQHGACRTADTAVFFAPDTPGEPQPERLRRLVQAKRVCAACPVREPCRAYALENEEEYGVWGGLSEIERRHLIAERRG